MNEHTAISLLKKFFSQQKRLPSYEEMRKLLGFASKKASFQIAQKLIDQGYLEKDNSGKLLPGKLFYALPVLGTIKAGYPVNAENELAETMCFDNFLVNNPGSSFVLKVSGDSMIEAGINQGDFVIIEKDKNPRNGDVVVAMIDNEFTLKKYQNLNGQVCLIPANRNYPVLYPKDSLTIWGVVVSVVRKYH